MISGGLIKIHPSELKLPCKCSRLSFYDLNRFVSISLEDAPRDESQEEETMISKLTDEKKYAMQQNKKLQKELELLRQERRKNRSGFSVTFVTIVALLGIIIGFLIKKT
ncbi:hypothetical protein GW17_00003482 [Ensete ventricosum]|nr:hypothetical protein GW17_00003482 [Ensete ventricosum]RZR82537.1 hypothetical protein BHM03_00008986 [Ensete ventricosum]